MSAHGPKDLQRIYDAGFATNLECRKAVWSVLVTDFFARHVLATDSVLDLGCGEIEAEGDGPLSIHDPLRVAGEVLQPR
jgi:hypothetical protein